MLVTCAIGLVGSLLEGAVASICGFLFDLWNVYATQL
jgi:hypothetical protein